VRAQYEALSENDSKQVENLSILSDAEAELAVWQEKKLQYAVDLKTFYEALDGGDVEGTKEYGELVIEEATELGLTEDTALYQDVLDKLSSFCFKNTVLMKPKMIVTPTIKKSSEDVVENGTTFNSYYFWSEEDLNEAWTEYALYADKYYKYSYNESKNWFEFQISDDLRMIITGYAVGSGDDGTYLLSINFKQSFHVIIGD